MDFPLQRDRGCGYCQSGQCESPRRGLLALEKNYPPMVATAFQLWGSLGCSGLVITVLQAICRSDFGEMREDVASRIKLRGSDTRLLAEMGIQGSGVRGGSGIARRLYSGEVESGKHGRKRLEGTENSGALGFFRERR